MVFCVGRYAFVFHRNRGKDRDAFFPPFYLPVKLLLPCPGAWVPDPITSLPREKGFVLMSDLAGTNPLEDGFGWTLDLNKEFIGKAATVKIKDEGVKRALLGFTVEDDAAEVAVGSDIVVNGVAAGKVTMFTYGYTVEKNIGYALVELDKANVGSAARIGDVDAVITERMFYDPENKRIRG